MFCPLPGTNKRGIEIVTNAENYLYFIYLFALNVGWTVTLKWPIVYYTYNCAWQCMTAYPDLLPGGPTGSSCQLGFHDKCAFMPLILDASRCMINNLRCTFQKMCAVVSQYCEVASFSILSVFLGIHSW